MPTLQEILAAKKAAQAAPSVPAPENIPKVEEKKPEERKLETPISPVAAIEATPAVVPEKKKSFAELMAEKKAAQNGTPVPTATPAPTPAPVINVSPLAEKLAATAKYEVPETATDAEKAYYQDIKPRIEALVSLADDDLKGAMKILKEAIMQNPSACELLLDQELGELTKAVRRMTGQSIVDAKKEKKEKKASKQIDLTDPTVMQAVLDEL